VVFGRDTALGRRRTFKVICHRLSDSEIFAANTFVTTSRLIFSSNRETATYAGSIAVPIKIKELRE
jgi:hypothetical protein